MTTAAAQTDDWSGWIDDRLRGFPTGYAPLPLAQIADRTAMRISRACDLRIPAAITLAKVDARTTAGDASEDIDDHA